MSIMQYNVGSVASKGANTTSKFLVSDENPEGYMLEDILLVIRKDLVIRCDLIIDDVRPEAEQVISNNMEILNLLTKAIHLAQNSTEILNSAFGPHGNEPRIGTE